MARNNDPMYLQLQASPGGRIHGHFKRHKRTSWAHNYYCLPAADRKRVKAFFAREKAPYLLEKTAEVLYEELCSYAYSYRIARGWFAWEATHVKPQRTRSIFEDYSIPAEDPAWRKLEF